MKILGRFEIRQQQYYLCSGDAGEDSAYISEPFVRVGEVSIGDKLHLILQKTARQKQKEDAPDVLLSLTQRELQIVIMVSEGLVNKVIADRLSISEWTVSSHIRRIFLKLRVDSRAEMVYRCARTIASHKASS